MRKRQSSVTDPASILHILDREDAFSREDEGSDDTFYSVDRFVQHLDTGALSTVEKIIGTLVNEKSPVILDLMASWDSHIPERLQGSKLIGLGMNRNELERNEFLDEYVIHDINRDPVLPFPDDYFDVVLNTVSVDYLTSPWDVFGEAARVLKPGGLFLVIFSNRFFPAKAVKIWKEATVDERMELVQHYFNSTAMFREPETYVSMGLPRSEDDKYHSLGIPGDPVFAVYAEKKPGRAGMGKRPALTDSGLPPIDRAEIDVRKKEIKHTLRCPYCDSQLRKWRVPNEPFIEWSNDFFYICFSDTCPYLIRGWSAMFKQRNHGLSYRLAYNPDKDITMPLPIHTLNDMKDGIVEDTP